MSAFREYFITLFSVCVLCIICEMLAEFSSNSVASALKVVCSTVLLLTVFSVLLNGCDVSAFTKSTSALTAFTDLPHKTITHDGIFMENTRLELEKSLTSAIYEKFGIKPNAVSIELNTETTDGQTEIRIEKISIFLPEKSDELMLSALNTFAVSLFGSDIPISIKRSS